MKTITQLIIQFTADSPQQAGAIIKGVADELTITRVSNHTVVTKPAAQNLLIKVEQTIHPEA